jgi:hypothetical protein
MLQLVTSDPEPVDIPEAQPMQSLPCSSHVPATRHGIASVYSAPTNYICTSDHHQGMSLEFAKIPPLFRHVRDAGTDSHVPFAFFWLIVCMALLTMHWNSFALRVSTIKRCSPLNLVSRAPYLLMWLVCWRISYMQTKRSFCPNYLDLLSLDWGTLYRFFILDSPHP